MGIQSISLWIDLSPSLVRTSSFFPIPERYHPMTELFYRWPLFVGSTDLSAAMRKDDVLFEQRQVGDDTIVDALSLDVGTTCAN